MPVYHRPRVAIIDPGGADVGGLVLIGAGVAVAAAVVVFVAAHAILLAVCAAVFVTVMGAVVAWMRWLASPRRLQEYRVAQRAALPPPRPARAITAPQPRAIEAPRTLPAATGVNRERTRRVR